jgi:hypothetical protein
MQIEGDRLRGLKGLITEGHMKDAHHSSTFHPSATLPPVWTG